MDDLRVFLARWPAVDESAAVWGDVRLRVCTHLATETPPLSLVTSVRAVVRRAGDVLVFRDRYEHWHLLPGGRREGDEPVEDTVRREVMEETGCAIGGLRRLGFIHFRHLTPKPPGYAYPYPDFIQLVYAAQAQEITPDSPIVDDWVIESRFVAVERAREMGIPSGELAFLERALRLD